MKNRQNWIPIVGIAALVLCLLFSASSKALDALSGPEMMMSGREYVQESVTPRPQAVTVTLDPMAGISLGRRNAIKSAQSYLKLTSFSRKGLVDQLRYEGYTDDEAVFAVDFLEPDFYAEAAEAAASYLRLTSFSKTGLYDQLIYEGFSEDEAAYGVAAVGY